MEISLINNPSKDLKKGAYNIPEPIESLRNNKNSVKKVDVVIVPAVAFSTNGQRIGYGGGYYDRFLERLNKNTKKIGLTYDELLYENLPQEEHDIPVDIIVTDKQLIHS